jgi:hypothetical protein
MRKYSLSKQSDTTIFVQQSLRDALELLMNRGVWGYTLVASKRANIVVSKAYELNEIG